MYTLKPIIDALLSTPYAKFQGDEHLLVRCPYCGDSKKHHDSAHCSIWVKVGKPLVFHCWICEEKGIVNPNFLESIGIYDLSIINQTVMFNKANSANSSTNIKWVKKPEDSLIPEIKDTPINKIRLEYMNNRLGIDFTYKALEYLRVIFSVNDFLVLNALIPNQKDIKRLKLIENHGIGFLSSSKDLITFRNFTGKLDFRYMKYKPYLDSLNNQFYTIPALVDPMKDSITLHIAEGPFDILGIFFHVMNRKTEDNIYVANNGSGYQRSIEYFIKKGFMCNLDIRIYSDSDKNKYYYKRMIDRLSPWVKSFRIFYNITEGEKDFGVPKDRIKIQEYVL